MTPREQISKAKYELAATRRDFGSDHPRTAESAENLASAYVAIWRYAKAKRLLKYALKIWQSRLGPKDKCTARCLAELGDCCRLMKQYTDARAHHERALAILRSLGNVEQGEIATSLWKVELDCKNAGDYESALRYAVEYVGIQEHQPGRDVVSQAFCIFDLAKLYDEAGYYEEAKAACQRAIRLLAKRRRAYHRDCVMFNIWLAKLHENNANPKLALQLCKKQVVSVEKKYGSNDCSLASPMLGMASAYMALGQYTKAASVCERVLKVCQNYVYLSASFENYARALNGLALCHQKKNQLREAKNFYEIAISVFSETPCQRNPLLATIMRNFASLLHDMGDTVRAKSLGDRADEIDPDD